MKLIVISLLISISLFSCQKEEMKINTGNDKLIGTWVNPQYIDTLITYDKAGSFIENEPGFTFKPGNTCIARQNSGWCGTPPITTADYEGIWVKNDSIVNITAGYWGGTVDFTWRVISVDNQKLVVIQIKSEFH